MVLVPKVYLIIEHVSHSTPSANSALNLWLGGQESHFSIKQLLLSKQQSPGVDEWEEYLKSCWIQKPISKRMKSRNKRAIAYVNSNSMSSLLLWSLYSSHLLAVPCCASLFFSLIFILPSTLLLPQCHRCASHTNIIHSNSEHPSILNYQISPHLLKITTLPLSDRSSCNLHGTKVQYLKSSLCKTHVSNLCCVYMMCRCI